MRSLPPCQTLTLMMKWFDLWMNNNVISNEHLSVCLSVSSQSNPAPFNVNSANELDLTHIERFHVLHRVAHKHVDFSILYGTVYHSFFRNYTCVPKRVSFAHSSFHYPCLFYSVQLCNLLYSFYSILFYSIIFYSILFYSHFLILTACMAHVLASGHLHVYSSPQRASSWLLEGTLRTAVHHTHRSSTDAQWSRAQKYICIQTVILPSVTVIWFACYVFRAYYILAEWVSDPQL